MSERPSLHDAITDAGEAIHQQVSLTPDSPLHEKAERWKELHGLDRHENANLAIARQAAFSTLLKTALYSVYRLNGVDLPELDSDHSLTERFALAKEKTNNEAFNDYFLDEITQAAGDDTLEPVIQARHLLLNAEDKTEAIGRIFEEIVLQDSRRKLGQFRTPNHVARVLAEWSIDTAEDRVLDPGMGAGALTARAYETKQHLPGEAHVEDMYGIDLSDLAVVMSATALKLVNGEGTPKVFAGDFMETIYPDAKEHLDTENAIQFPKFDAILSNPPYSRHHELSKFDKSRIKEIAQAESGLSLSGHSPMYLFFFVHAAQFLAPGGKMAFLTPSEFLETNYGEPLKQFLLDEFHIRALILHNNQDSLIFDGAKTTSCITLLEKKTGDEEPSHTQFIELSEWPLDVELLDDIQNDTEGDTNYGHIRLVDQTELSPDEKWTHHFGPDTEINPIAESPDLKPLREIGTLKRGIATGKNDYFCLTKDEVEAAQLDTKYLSPLVRQSRGNPRYNYTKEDLEKWTAEGEEVWLLYHANENRGDIDDIALDAYLRYGEEIGADSSHLASNRDPWYLVERREPADILATYMSKHGFKFINNEAGVRNLNNLHSIYLESYDPPQVKALLAYLNSSVADEIVRKAGRTYATGLKKVEPNELKDAPVMDPGDLTHEQTTTLAGLFEDLCAAARSETENEDDVTEQIDAYLSDVFANDLQADSESSAVGSIQ